MIRVATSRIATPAEARVAMFGVGSAGGKEGLSNVVHQLGCALQPLGREVIATCQEIPYPLVMDVIAPARPETPGARQPHQQVTDVRGIQDACVEYRRERRAVHS